MTTKGKTDEATLKHRLSKAKAALILEHPFVGSIAMAMPFLLDENLNPPTAATNGKRVVFHPGFVASMDDEELKFVVAHECLHPMLEHTVRRGHRQPRRWNQAADYVINHVLTEDKIGRMPKIGLLNPQIYIAGGGTTDGIYEILPPTDEDNNGSGGSGGPDPLDNCEDGGQTPAEITQQAAEWKVKVAQAAQAAKMMGNMSANMQRLVGEVLEAKVNWRDVLARFMQKARTDQRTFARPNRRFISQGMYMPSVSGEQMGEIYIAVDCSGSIGPEEIAQFAGEIHKIKDDCNPTAIHVGYFDSEVCHYERFGQEDDLHIEPHGGGGTDFAPIFRHIVDNGINPVAIVFLTDMYGPFGDTPPEAPLLWISTSQINTAPFGEVVMMHAKQGV